MSAQSITPRDLDLREAPNTVLRWVLESLSTGAPAHAASIRDLITRGTALYSQYLSPPMSKDETETVERVAWVRYQRGEVRQ